jgi:hypothetical protein
MKKTLLIAIGLIVLLAVSAGSYIYFSLPDKAAAPKGKPNAEGVFESKRELNPSGTKAFYFTSTSDITAKRSVMTGIRHTKSGHSWTISLKKRCSFRLSRMSRQKQKPN